MPFYYDTIYWILLIPVLILSVYAQIRVSSSFGRYSRDRNCRGVTGAQAAFTVKISTLSATIILTAEVRVWL